jgi:hypothetical protein
MDAVRLDRQWQAWWREARGKDGPISDRGCRQTRTPLHHVFFNSRAPAGQRMDQEQERCPRCTRHTPHTPCTPRSHRPRYIPRMGIHIQDTLLASAHYPRLQPPVPPAYLCGPILSSCLRFVCRHSRPRHPRCIPSTSRVRSRGNSYGQCRPSATVIHAHAYHRPNLPQTLAAYLLASILLKLFVTQLPQLISL